MSGKVLNIGLNVWQKKNDNEDQASFKNLLHQLPRLHDVLKSWVHATSKVLNYDRLTFLPLFRRLVNHIITITIVSTSNSLLFIPISCDDTVKFKLFCFISWSITHKEFTTGQFFAWTGYLLITFSHVVITIQHSHLLLLLLLPQLSIRWPRLRIQYTKQQVIYDTNIAVYQVGQCSALLNYCLLC